MKKTVIKSVVALGCSSLCLAGCGKEEIPYFDSQYDAVRFNTTDAYDAETGIFKASYSFLENPEDEYGEYELPLVLVGNVSPEDRTVNYEIVKEETTAPENSYEITGALIPADSLKGSIKIRMLNTEEIQNGASYTLYIRLKESPALGLGPKEQITATLSWDSDIYPPESGDRYVWMTYNSLIKSSVVPNSSNAYSRNALKAIVAALGWDNWDDMAAHPDMQQSETLYTYKYLPNYRLLILGNLYEAYAAILADYLKAYREEHPDAPLVHDGGDLKGQIIEARTY